MKIRQTFDYYVRSLTTSLLAIGILGISAWQVIGQGKTTGPFVDWSGLVVGAYFVHYARNGKSGNGTPPPPEPPPAA